MNLIQKPGSASDLLAQLKIRQVDLGRNGRRLVTFLLENPGDAAVLSSPEVARRCGVNASSVVRLVQSLGFSGYREFQAILQKNVNSYLKGEAGLGSAKGTSLKLRLIAESGKSFNQAAAMSAENYSQIDSLVEISTETYASYDIDPDEFAARIDCAAGDSDGIILVARDHVSINEAVRRATAKGVPVICLTTDLPLSGRTAYVGSDQYVSGATAAWLCGRMMPAQREGKVLFVYSVPFRCHQDREQGFRNVLRSEFPALSIDEKVSSNESADVIYEAVKRYIHKNGPPAALYNVSGANFGVGRALEDEGIAQTTLFFGHELNVNSRLLLERGVMDVAIGHDFDKEITLAVECIKMAQSGIQPMNRVTQSLVFTRFNCAIF